MSLLELCAWLETTAVAAIARESLYGFQILVAIHILGIAFSVGILLWMDLRMLGLGLVGIRLSRVYRNLMPWFLAGFATMLISGMMIFAGFATSAYENTFFRIKLVAMLLAAANAFAYHVMTRNISTDADTAERPPMAVRCSALASISLWAIVILCGRMISYTLF